MAKAKPFKTIKPKEAKNRAVLIDYDSIFTPGIENTIRAYNRTHPEDVYTVDMYKASSLENLADVGDADKVIHTGGVGKPVRGNAQGNPDKLYICHSHQWKAKEDGGELGRLSEYREGPEEVYVKEDDPVIGKKGSMPIDKYHVLAVTKPPKNAKVIATSKQILEDGREAETAEALRYDDGSISVQGHPGGGTAGHIIHNFLGGKKKDSANDYQTGYSPN